MISQFSRFSAREVVTGRTIYCSFFVLLFLVSLFGTRAANAQITAEFLIGESVSDLGPRYSDVDEAIKRFGNRDPLGARQFLESAKRKNPKLPPVDLMMAKMHFASDNGTAGQAALEATVMENPSDPEPYILLGDQAIAVGRTIDSEALYEKALELLDNYDENPKRKRHLVIRARNGHALVAERRRDWDAAVEDLNILVDEDPENAGAIYRLGRALFMDNKQREGYDKFAQAQKLDSDLPHPMVTSALLYEQLGSHDEAKKAFENAVRADRQNVKTLISYAQWLIQAGDAATAEKALTEARSLEPESVDVLSLSGVAARMNKKMKPAEDYFVEALRLAPSNGGVINQLAQLLIDQPDEEKRKRALEFAQINATLRPNSSEANISLAWVMYNLGRRRDANNALRKGLQLGGLNADSSYLVAQMLASDQPQVAQQILEKALQNGDGTLFIMRADAQKLLDSLSD